MGRVVLALLSAVLMCSAEFVDRKYCSDVDPSLCSIHEALVEPCSSGPDFCGIKRKKLYDVNLNFTPHFSASALKWAMYGDYKGADNFSILISPARDLCSVLTCPVHAEANTDLSLGFNINKKLTGKFPLKLKFWNSHNETEACCFTFKVYM